MEPTRTQHESYACQRLIGHLATAGHTERLFDLVDQRGFLARQADHFGEFGRTGEDIENHLLPAAIEAEDWNRFVQYAAIALNLRGMAEDLAEPEILSALARSGQIRLADDSASRIPDPLRRAAARAVIAAEQRNADSLFRQQLEAIERDLEAPLAPPAGVEEVRRRVGLLADMARRLGVDFDASWPAWIDKAGLSAEQASPVWRAVAEAWLDRGDPEAPGLWEALARTHECEELLAFLPERLGALALENAETLLVRLPGVFNDEGNRHRATMSFLTRFSADHPEPAAAIWERWIDGEDVSWTEEMIEIGKAFFARLEPRRLEVFCAKISEPLIVAALRVVMMEAEPTADKARTALEAIENIPDGPSKLHWALRYLKACPREPQGDVCSQIEGVRQYFDEIRFDASPNDLRWYLELVAELFKDRLPSQVDEVIWSLGGRPETLLDLAQQAESPEILQYIIDKAELFSVGVAADSQEGFSLRRAVLIRATTRLCLKRKKLDTLEELSARLLPEEERAIFDLVASGVSPLEIPHFRMTQYAPGRLRSRHQQLLASLNAPSTDISHVRTAPSILYRSLSRIDVLEDELIGLRALQKPSENPHDIIDNDLLSIRSSRQKMRALLRFGCRAIEFQDLAFAGVEDRLYPIEAIQNELTVDGDDELVALTPEIAELGARAGGQRVAVELYEAARRLLSYEFVPWAKRLQSLDDLFARFLPILQAMCRNRQHRQIVRCLGPFLRLPLELEPESVRLYVRSQWHEVLPVVVAVLDRLSRFPERQDVEKLMLAGLDFPANPLQKQVFDLCRESPEKRELREHQLFESSFLPQHLGAVMLLLSASQPQRVVELMRQTPPGSTRDQTCLRLLRHSWITGTTAFALADLIQDQHLLRMAAVWIRRHQSGDSWLPSLAELLADRRFDAADPRTESVVHALWTCDRAVSLPILANAIPIALESGGRPQSEPALCLWLHSLHPPRSGAPLRDDAATVDESLKALRLATSLAPTPQNESTGPAEKLYDRLRYERIYRRFRRAQGNLLGTIAHRSFSLEARSSHAVMACFIFCMIEALLWLPPEAQTKKLPPVFDTLVALQAPFAFFFVVTRPLSGFIFTLVLARRLPRQRFPLWLRAISVLVSCMPLIGTFALSLWIPQLTKRVWAPPPRLSLLPQEAKSCSKISTRGPCLLTSPFPFFWLAADAPFLIFFAMWITYTPEAFAPFRRETIFALCLAFHALGFASMTIDVRHNPSQENGWRHRIRPLLPFTFLLPFPAQLVIPIVHLSRQSATGSQWDQRRIVEGNFSWRKLEASLRRHWLQVSWTRQWRRPIFLASKLIAGNAEMRVHYLCRRKALLLVPESFAVMLGVIMLLAYRPEGIARLNQGYWILVAMLVSLIILSLLCEVAKGIARLLRLAKTRDNLELKSYGRYAYLTLSAVLWGSQLGMRFAAGEIKQIGVLLFLISAVACLYNYAFPLPFTNQQNSFLLGLVTSIAGFLLSRKVTPLEVRDVAIVAISLVVLMAYGFFVGATTVCWLLRPFTRQHLTSPHLPLRFRAVLWTMVATALLPLGGLAVPFWIWARHRLWPRYEHFGENG